MLKPFIDKGDVIIIDESGNHLDSDNIKLTIKKNKYQIKRKKSRQNPIEMLKKKMIRRPGHFERRPEEGMNTSCIRFTYDGSECEDELTDLINSYVIDEYENNESPSHILYYREFSSWLKQPVMASAKRVDAESMHINKFLDNIESIDCNKLTPPLIVFPLVDTGKTIEGLLEKWENACNGILPSPKLLIVMIGDRSFCRIEEKKHILIKTTSNKYLATFFMKVGRGTVLQKDCDQCKLKIPYTNLKKEEFAEIPTYDMWFLANEAGWIKEDNIPKERSGLAVVPNFHKLIRENGAWLAFKIRELLVKYYQIESFIAEPILIVCPEEDGSTALAEYIQVIQGFTIITIPKHAIDKCSEKNAGFNDLVRDWKDEGWLKQLNTASSIQPIMILEEFIVTGGTAKALHGLLTFLDKNVKYHFSLVDWTFRENGAEDMQLPLYSLYQVETTEENFISASG